MTQEISQIIAISAIAITIGLMGFFLGYLCGKENSLAKTTILDDDRIFKDKQVKPNHLSFKEKVSYISEVIWIHFPNSDSGSYAELMNEILMFLCYKKVINNKSLHWLIARIQTIKNERDKE